MPKLLERPWAERTLRGLTFCGAGMFGARLLQLQSEPFLGLVLYTPVFAGIGFVLGMTFGEATKYQYDTVRPSRLAKIGRFMLYSVIAVYAGWLLWQPWLWLTR
jgi:hypothetical protein